MKGLTPVIAVTMITLMSVGAASTVYIVFQDLSSKGADDTPGFLDSQHISLEYNERSQNFAPHLRVVNEGDGEEIVTIESDNDEVYNGVIEANSDQVIHLKCLDRDNEKIRLIADNFEITEETDVSDGYCFDIIDDEVVFDDDSNSFREWNITAYRNDDDKTPYSNREVDIDFGNSQETLKTDSDGNFSITTDWDVNYVPEDNFWSHSVSYSSDSNYQPPNKVGLKYEDGTEKFSNTQMGYSTTSSSYVDHSFDITPLDVQDEEIKFEVKMNLELLQGIEDDVSNNPGSKLLYQIPFRSGGNYASILNLECFDDSDVSCNVKTVQPHMSSDIDGQSLEYDSLPTNSDDEKIIPIDRKIESGEDVIFGYNSYDDVYDKDSSTYHRLSHDKRMIYIPSDSDYKFYRNYTLDSIEDTIESQGGVSDPDINTSYRSRRQLVPTANGWTARPYLGTNRANFDLEDSHSPSSAFSPSSREAVLFKWDNVDQGSEHSIGFNITFNRDPNDNKVFWLPTNLGIFGVFPEDGGEAVSSGGRYNTYHTGISRNTIPQRDRPAFQATIPKQESDDAMAYKISNRDGDTWETTTYILNTIDQQIEEIYLLDSRGEWIDIKGDVGGGAFPDPGESWDYDFDIGGSSDSVTQMNIRFQTIHWDTSKPDQTGWPYSFNLELDGSEEDYDFDLDGSISCNYRYCNSYRTSNRDTSRPITNLIGGDSAPKDTFDEELNSGNIRIENHGSSGEVQNFRRFQFWIWDMERITSDLENQLIRPDYMRLETESEDFYKSGFYREEFS